MYNREVATIKENGKVITIASLAFPLLIQSLISSLINTASVLVLAGYSETAVTATSMADQITGLVNTVLGTIATGTAILASIALGAENRKKAASICTTGLLLSFFTSLIAGLCISVAAAPLIQFMNLTGSSLKMATVYLRITALTMPLGVLRGFFHQLLITNGYAKPVFVSGTVTTALSAIFTYAVLYLIPLSSDVMVSLGIKTALVQLIGFFLDLFFFVHKKCPFRLSFCLVDPFKILKLGLPACMCTISFSLSNTITAGFLAKAGDTAINAKVYINNIITYVPMIGYAIARATSIIVGRHRGAGRLESIRTLFRQNLTVVLLINATLSIIVFFLHKPLLSLFTTDSAILSTAWLILLIDIPLEIARGVNNISENVLNPNGDVKTTMLVSVFSGWVFSVLLGYVLCVSLSLDLLGLWIAFLANEAFKAVVYLFRWHSNKWQKTKV